MHAIEVDAESARFAMTIENIPSADNPRTGQITGLSVIALLRRLGAPLVVGAEAMSGTVESFHFVKTSWPSLAAQRELLR